MFIVANLLETIAAIIHLALRLYTFIIIARAVISWVNPDPYNPIVNFLYRATEPVLYRVRRTLPLPMGFVDLSPLVVLLVIFILDQFVVGTLYDIAFRLK